MFPNDKYIENLRTFDFALGTHIINMFQTTITTGGTPFQNFLKRPPSEKIWRCHEESPSEFLAELAASGKVERLVGSRRVNMSELPLICYGRGTEFSNMAEGSTVGGMPCPDPRTIKIGEETHKVGFNPIRLKYRIIFMANDKSTLSEMWTAWSVRSRLTRVIPASGMIGDFDLQRKATIGAYQTEEWDDQSRPKEDGRLWASSREMTIYSYFVSGTPVVYPKEIQLFWGRCGFCEGCIDD